MSKLKEYKLMSTQDYLPSIFKNKDAITMKMLRKTLL